MIRSASLAIIPPALFGVLPAAACADEPLALNLSAVYAESPADEPAPLAANPGNFGEPGSWFIHVGAGAAHDFHESLDANIYLGFSTFVARELELQIEVGGWYFAQPGDDTGGLSLTLGGRWHFLHADNFAWTIYAEAGIGLLGAFDQTPPGGTNFNFLPRAGLGFTTVLPGMDARLEMGVRWHHVSNARITGDDNNPARNSLMVYAGVVFPL